MANLSINYTVNKEHFIDPKTEVFIATIDERPNKEVLGNGAKTSFGKDAIGYIMMPVIYAAIPHEPNIKEKDNLTQIFNSAMAERLSKNGIMVTSEKESTALAIDLLIKHFILDINVTWVGEVGYVAKIKKNGKIICETDIYEKATVFNWAGFDSGGKALNEAFNKAINKLDVNSCFSKLYSS